MNQGYSHPYLTEDTTYLTKEAALMSQKDFDPVGYSEFIMIDNLDSKQAYMYSKYMDS
ncbi:MAG: hypothetical protein WCI60_03265 [bacterium]